MSDPNSTDSAARGRPGRGAHLRKHRWPDGTSGNPRGRPPKSKKGLTGHLQDALHETVSVTIAGEARKITKLQAMAMQIANKVASGDLRAIGQLKRLLAESPADVITPEPDTPLLHPETFRNLVARLRSTEPLESSAAKAALLPPSSLSPENPHE